MTPSTRKFSTKFSVGQTFVLECKFQGVGLEPLFCGIPLASTPLSRTGFETSLSELGSSDPEQATEDTRRIAEALFEAMELLQRRSPQTLPAAELTDVLTNISIIERECRWLARFLRSKNQDHRANPFRIIQLSLDRVGRGDCQIGQVGNYRKALYKIWDDQARLNPDLPA